MRALRIDQRAYGPSRRGFGLPMRQRRFLLTGLLAIAASAGLHYAVFEYAHLEFSSLAGSPPVDETPREVVVLQDEDQAALDRQTFADAILPVDPAMIVPESAPIEPPAANLEPADLPAPKAVDIGNQLEGIDKAMQAPDAAALPAASFDARRELMEIDETLHREDVVTVPREFIPDVKREIDVPDIAPPQLPEMSSLPVAAAPEPPPLAAPRAAPPPIDSIAALPPPSFDSLLPDARIGDPVESPELLAAQIRAAAEPRPAQEHKAVEQLLDINVTQFSSPEDAQYLYFKVAVERGRSAVSGQGGLGGRAGTDAAAAPSLPVLPKGVVLMQDCSMSITQPKLDEFKKGAVLWLESIRPGDYFNVISFSDGVEAAFADLVPMTPQNKQTARWFVDDMGLRGKTDVYASLQKLQAMSVRSPVPVVAILLTDGRPTVGLQDSTDIIEKFTREAGGKLSVFCVGGGSRANEYLLDLLSYRNRGDSILVGAASQLPKAMGNMADQLERPVLADLRYAFTGEVQPEVYPTTLTHLYLDRPLEIFGRVPRAGAGKLAFQVVGTSKSRETHDMVFQLDPRTGGQGDAYLRQQWAWHKMYHLIGTYLKTRDASQLAQIRLMASKFNLRVPYISGTRGGLAPVAQPIP